MKKRSKTCTGILWMLAAQAIFVSTWTVVKYVGREIPVFEIAFFRAVFSLVVLIPLTHMRLKTFKGRNLSILFLRALFGTIGMISAFYAMINMNLGDAVTLFNTMPILVALLAPAFLGEAFSKKQFFIIIIAFIGIALIIQPGKEMLDTTSLIALLSAFAAALAMLCMRKLGSSDSPYIITLYFTIFTAVVSAPMAFHTYIPPTPSQWGWLIFIGVVITFAQLFMAKAYKCGKASNIAAFSYASVVGAYFTALIFFSEIPDFISIIGAIIIVVAGAGITLISPQKTPPGSTPAART